MQKLFVMVGVPGSGKTVFAKELAEDIGAVHIDVNKVRYELTHNYSDTKHHEEVFAKAHAMMLDALEEGKNVIFDATSVSRKARKSILDYIPENLREKIEVIAVFINIPLEKSLERNKARSRIVPERVVLRMYRQMDFPRIEEGFDCVLKVFN